MFRRTFALLISVLAVAAIAVGCGSDDSSDEASGSSDGSGTTTTTTSSLSKAEFIKQADPVCKKANDEKYKKFQAFSEDQQTKKPPSEAELIETYVVPTLEKQITAMDELGTPEGDSGELEEFRTELDSVLAEAKDTPTGEEVTAVPYEKLEKAANKYGFEYCGHA